MKFARFRRLCLAMPEAEERETWGEPTFRVRVRIFATASPEGDYVSVKASLDDQAGLVEMDPRTFTVSAYTGRFGWVTVRLAGLGPELAERLVTNAWERTAPRRLASTETEKAARKPSAGSRLGRLPGAGRRSTGSRPR
jgi:hypothetical protein